MKDEYIIKINELLNQTNDLKLLDLIYQILRKSINPQKHEASA